MAKLTVWEQSWGARYWFFCPGCRTGHAFTVRTDGKRPSWTFDGDMERPTFSPSLLCPDLRCHLFLRGGVLQFLPDCSHALAGQSVPLPDIPDGQA